MRWPAAIATLLAAIVLTACGGGDDPSSPSTESLPAKPSASSSQNSLEERPAQQSRRGKLALSKAERTKLPEIVIAQRNGPPPKKLVVNDLRKGAGAAVTLKDAIGVKYYSVTFDEAQEKSNTGHFPWTTFGLNEVVKGWELGLPGMRVGGRRELIVPPQLGYEGSTLIYVIDLLSLVPGGAGSF